MGDGPSLQSRLVAEAFGTFMLCLTVFGCVLGSVSPAFAAIAIASVLAIMVYSLGEVSGAHLNPAVSFSIALSKQQAWDETFYYMGVQVLGGLLASGVSFAVFGQGLSLTPGAGHSWAQAGFAELFFTCMLCFVVLNTACCRANAGNQYFGLAIGYVIAAGGYAIGGVSGANLNPAVSIALDLSAGKPYWCVVYIAFQLVGAFLAYFLYKLVRPEEFGGQKSGNEALVAEFLGTFFLVLTAGCNVVNGTVSAALSIGAALMCMVYAVGSVSGAHLNPAVTLAILLSGRNKIDGTTACQYVASQVGGAIAGGLSYKALYGKTFGLAPAAQGWLPLAEAEILFTFVLCYVVLTVATTARPSKDMFGLAIGSCVTVGGYAAGAVGGGVLNPAAAIGLATANAVGGGSGFLNSLGYAALECAGGAVAAGLFQQTHFSEYSKAG